MDLLSLTGVLERESECECFTLCMCCSGSGRRVMLWDYRELSSCTIITAINGSHSCCLGPALGELSSASNKDFGRSVCVCVCGGGSVAKEAAGALK